MLTSAVGSCAAEDGINGLDVSPNGRRLATCGRNIIIWNMLPILDSKAEQDPDVPKVLAIMQEQEKGVLAVAFSNSGKFLAAGSSYPDNSVLIFKQVASPATTNMSIKFTGKENWRPTAPALKHHINDVTSLSWSPGDEYLASGSMDGNVLIWKVNQGQCLTASNTTSRAATDAPATEPHQQHNRQRQQHLHSRLQHHKVCAGGLWVVPHGCMPTSPCAIKVLPTAAVPKQLTVPLLPLCFSCIYHILSPPAPQTAGASCTTA